MDEPPKTRRALSRATTVRIPKIGLAARYGQVKLVFYFGRATGGPPGLWVGTNAFGLGLESSPERLRLIAKLAEELAASIERRGHGGGSSNG
jgi:hypothetical protein